MKYLGIDWGEKRIGLSLGDSELKIASPFKVVSGLNELVDIIKKEEIDEIIIGDPIKMSGRESDRAEFDEFVGNLKKKTSLSIELIDERLTSKAADSLPGDKKTKSERDAIAAMLILQTYLDKIK